MMQPFSISSLTALSIFLYSGKLSADDANPNPEIRITLPAIGETIEVQPGDMIAESFDATVVEAAEFAVLSERLARRTRSGWVRLPKGTTLLVSNDGWYCTSERTRAPTSRLPQASICLKDRDKDGTFDVTGGLFGRNLSSISVSYDIPDQNEELVPSDSFRRALFFGGFQNNRVSLIYIEYDGDPTDPSKRLDGSVAFDETNNQFQFGEVVFKINQRSHTKIDIERVSGDL